MDCVSECGDLAIAYTGRVGWGGVRLGFSSVLESTEAGTSVSNSLSTQSDPVLEGQVVRWCSGEWRARCAPIRESVLKTADGNIDWECLMPISEARVGRLRGSGYVERLTMSIAPWKLPFRSLEWGRFHSASDWLVWIETSGRVARRICYWNGAACEAPLALEQVRVLREGRLGAVALASIPGVHTLFPSGLLNIHELKVLSRGRLGNSTGWAIHEKVTWPE